MKIALGTSYKMSSLDHFMNEITKEEDKLIQMGTIKPSKSHALAANRGTKDQKGPSKKEKKQKNQGEKKQEQNLVAPKASNDASSSKGDKPKKEKTNCSYCKKNGRDEHKCLKKQIDHLSHLLKKNNIKVPDSFKTTSSQESSKDTSKGNKRTRIYFIFHHNPIPRLLTQVLCTTWLHQKVVFPPWNHVLYHLFYWVMKLLLKCMGEGPLMWMKKNFKMSFVFHICQLISYLSIISLTLALTSGLSSHRHSGN